jgi:hypothetical protein
MGSNLSNAILRDFAAVPLVSEALLVKSSARLSNSLAVVHWFNGLLASVCAQDVIMYP